MGSLPCRNLVERGSLVLVGNQDSSLARYVQDIKDLMRGGHLMQTDNHLLSYGVLPLNTN